MVLCRDLREQGLPSKIGISINKKSRRPYVVLETGPDLLSRHVMENNSLSLHGWWMSHVQWDVTEYKQSPERKTRQASSYYNSLCCMRSENKERGRERGVNRCLLLESPTTFGNKSTTTVTNIHKC